jgi:hypothetical protein
MFNAKYSQDGKKVMVTWNRWQSGGLWIISLEDSSQVFLFPETLSLIRWSSDGKWAYAYEKGKPSKILMIPVSGGKAKTFLTLPFENVGFIDIHPDGKKIIFTVPETRSDAWLMENFDPDVE